MTDQHPGRVTRFIQSMRDSTPDHKNREQLPDRDDRADWDADDSGVHSAKMRYDEGDNHHFQYKFEAVDLDLHSSPDDEVSIIAEEDTDDWRSIVLRFDADTAAELAEQLELAAEKAREGQGADVRL